MKPWRINHRHITMWLVGGYVATNVLVGLAHLTGWWPLKVLLFVCITLLPGVSILRLLRITPRTIPTGLVYSFGLSILVLMLSGLAANQLLPLFGINRPLGLLGAIGAWNIVTGILVGTSIRHNVQPIILESWSPKTWPRSAWLLAMLSVLLPCIAMLGAFRLNNGGNAHLAELSLCLAAALIACGVIFRRRLPDGLLVWLIFIIGLTVLLMTSLRGWDIVGHDIEREFRVYTLAHLNERWDISLDRDSYNACLSITILPQMLAQILDISGLVAFKVVLQIIFAVCPVVVFVLLRQYSTKLGALFGSLLFICYPTFINDSAMLTRQGVAYLFFALALLIISNKSQRHRHKILFLLCALGAILSHYSTAYMFVALFAVAVVCKLCVVWMQRRQERQTFSKIQPLGTILSPIFAALLFLMAFVWYTQVTSTSDGLVVTLKKTVMNLPRLFSEDNRSADTSTALLFAGGKTQVDLYESYLSTSREPTTKMASALQYLPALTNDHLPITKLGERAHAIGISPSLIASLRQNFAKVLQVLALGGVMYVTYKLLRKKQGALSSDFIYLSLAGMVILSLMVMLPVLSMSYGLLRAFQQALIFLILPIIMLLTRLGRSLWPWLKTMSVTVGTVFLFLLFTGFFAQILGGTSPSLSLNNQGLYHGLFYSSEADARAFRWLKQHVKKGSDVRAANFNRAIMHDPNYPFARAGILPSQTGTGTFTYTDPAQVQAKKVYLYYESSPLIMTFPLDYYDDTKNLIYSTSSTRIYR
jgi:uncharacterized membrane protein